MKKLLIESIGRLDIFVWVMVIVFFCGSALIFGGNMQMAFLGASGIIVEMLFIGLSIEIIIEALKNTKGIGTITGFITNGPEALCLLVGLLVGDIIFAASTPLGSNFMNPVLLIIAAIICRQHLPLLKTHPLYTWVTISFTATMAIIFFTIDTQSYLIWLLIVMVVTLVLFFIRPKEPIKAGEKEDIVIPKLYLLPAILVLTCGGYFLDSVVSFAATHSHAPKGVIGFVVLATLTSWPEFKSCIALLARNNIIGAMLNITVSNITNIWLAALGVSAYLIAN